MMASKKLFLSELKARYKQLYDAVQPIPYIRDRLYRVDSVFVEGGIEYLAETWTILGSYHHLFSEDCVKSNRRFLIGEPGYGKSTLTLQYAYDWCNGVQESYLKDVEILILLKLRQLGGVTSIYNAIKRFILSSRSQLSENDIESILRNSFSVVVILDGFDEYPDEERYPLSDVMKIICLHMFQQFEVILTTRYLPKQFPPDTKRLRLIGFDDRARGEYIRKAVVGDDVVAADRIKRLLQENPILGDLCQVPLFFVMFAHMCHENKDFQTFNTVTSFFQYMIQCFHQHTRNKMDDANVQRYNTFESDHFELDCVAFDGLSRRDQQIMWSKQELLNRIGKDFYDLYMMIGILVKEEDIGNVDMYGSSSSDEDQREVRFYHKVFCEWYAAHYLAEYAARKPSNLKNVLRHMDPLDVQYFYRFACGLNPEAAGSIIECVKQHNGGEKFATLCILEQGGRVEDILDTVMDLCSKKIHFRGEDNKLLQRSTVQLLEIASKRQIPILFVCLTNCYSTVDMSGGKHLRLKSNLPIPVLTTLSKLTIHEEGRKITPEEFATILQYSSKCLALKELELRWCLLPQFVQAESVSVLRSRNVEVLWYTPTFYRLNLKSRCWERIHNYDDRRVRGVMTDAEYQGEVKIN